MRGKDVAEWLQAHGRIAHASAAYEHGFTKRDLAHAVSAFGVTRVRRSWLTTLSDTSPVRRAVAIGGRLTCVSEARRLGLWVPGPSEPHVWVPSTASRFDASGLRIHRARGPVPPGRFVAYEALPNVLLHVSSCLPRQEALAVWESALRQTSLTKEMLENVDWPTPRARELADAAGGLSDSGLETRVVVRLRRRGLSVRQQVWLDGHPVDALVGNRLVLQIDGKHHLDPAQRRRDTQADARLALMGYTVLRFDYREVMFDWPRVERTVLLAVAQGRHL